MFYRSRRSRCHTFMGAIIRKANIDGSTWPAGTLKCQRSASSAFQSLFSWSGSAVFSFFCFFFVMFWSQTQPCFNVWIWMLLNLALFLQTNSWLFFFFSLPSFKCPFVTDVESVWFWSHRPLDTARSQWFRLCGATVISVFLYFQGSCSAINVTSAAQAWC